MTIVVQVDMKPLEQVTKQLNKLVEVLKIVELEPAFSVQQQLLLAKVTTTQENRRHVLDVVDLFGAKVIDV